MQDRINVAIEKKTYSIEIKNDFKSLNERLIPLGTILKESHCNSVSTAAIDDHHKTLGRIMTGTPVVNNQFSLSVQDHNLAKNAAKKLQRKKPSFKRIIMR